MPLKLPLKFFKKHDDLPCIVTMVMKRIALLGILEKLARDCQITLECELLKPPREQNGTAQHSTAQNDNCTQIEWRRNGYGTEQNGPLNSRSMATQQTGNGNFLLTPSVSP